MSQQQVPAGWYPDPDPASAGERYWDGRAWTEHARPAAAPGGWAAAPAGGLPEAQPVTPAWPDGHGQGPSATSPYGGGYAPAPYGPSPAYPVAPSYNGLSIASMVLGILWLYCVGSILAIIFGHIALRHIRRSGQRGRGMAIAGLVLGYVGLAASLVTVIVAIAVAAN